MKSTTCVATRVAKTEIVAYPGRMKVFVDRDPQSVYGLVPAGAGGIPAEVDEATVERWVRVMADAAAVQVEMAAAYRAALKSLAWD